MYLNGTRLKQASRLSRLSLEEIREQSDILAEDIAYYWDNPF
jgi:hypothetical protein